MTIEPGGRRDYPHHERVATQLRPRTTWRPFLLTGQKGQVRPGYPAGVRTPVWESLSGTVDTHRLHPGLYIPWQIAKAENRISNGCRHLHHLPQLVGTRKILSDFAAYTPAGNAGRAPAERLPRTAQCLRGSLGTTIAGYLRQLDCCLPQSTSGSRQTTFIAPTGIPTKGLKNFRFNASIEMAASWNGTKNQ